MIPQTEQRDVFTSGVDDSVSFGISDDDVAHIMGILRDTMYSDKILAVIREYASNAWDAHREAGKADVPIRVQLPTLLEAVFKVRDFGPGLSHQDIRRVFTQYGKSTKRDDNAAVGMLGIGSKSGFAYSDSFTVTSWHAVQYDDDFIGPRCGVRRTYVAVLDSTNKGRMDLMDSTPCDPADTGLEVQIPVQTKDFKAFEEKALKVLTFMDPRPTVNAKFPEAPKGYDYPNVGFIRSGSDAWDNRGFVAVMGCVPYRIDLNHLTGIANAVTRTGGHVRFEIGELQVAASREELKYSDSTKAALVTRLNGLMATHVEALLKDMDSKDEWTQRLRVRELDQMGFTTPPKYRHLDASFVYLWNRGDANEPKSFRLATSYRDKLQGTSGVQVRPGVRIVFRDDNRSVAGYSFESNDVVLSVTPGQVNSIAMAELHAALTRAKLVGLPIAMSSKLPWKQPTKGPGSPRDTARAKSKCFVFDPNVKLAFDDKKAKAWTPVDRVPKDTDVFVVLKSYKVENSEYFYDEYREYARFFAEAKLVMPGVIGYKSTEAYPVDAAKLKGTDWNKWREGPATALLLSNKDVYERTVARDWARLQDNAFKRPKSEDLAKRFGPEHPLTLFFKEQEEQVRFSVNHALGVISGIAHRLTFVKPETRPAGQAQAALLKRYPLLRIANYQASLHEHADAWFDYIDLIDMVHSDNGKQKEEKAA